MADNYGGGHRNRRTFLKSIAVAGAGALSAAPVAPQWKKQIGLELYTVRELLKKDYEGTLAKIGH